MNSLLLLSLLCVNGLFARVITISKNSKIQSLKEAFLIANHKDTIYLREGVYKEHDLIINKKIVLIGVGKPWIDGEEKHQILTVKADSVIISGIGFKGSGTSFVEDQSAVKFEDSHGGEISNCHFEANFFAIYLAKSSGIIVKNNTIKSDASRETTSGNGIHLWYCKEVKISNNNISGHRDGIYLEFVQNSLIEDNYSSYNLRYGLHFMFSHGCVYERNRFEGNGSGVAVMYTREVIMKNNRFINNWGPSSFGVLLKEIYDSRIENNYFQSNTTALFMEASNRIEIKNNNFLQNGYALKIMANSMDNHITKNNFIDNTFDVSTNSQQNFSKFYGNYWSHYKGYDLDKDKIGDQPYYPVRFFSIITEKQASSMILLRSLFIQILEMSESVFPSLTPETLNDPRPEMERIQ